MRTMWPGGNTILLGKLYSMFAIVTIDSKKYIFRFIEMYVCFNLAQHPHKTIYYYIPFLLSDRRLDGSVTAQKEIVQRAQRQLVRFQVTDLDFC